MASQIFAEQESEDEERGEGGGGGGGGSKKNKNKKEREKSKKAKAEVRRKQQEQQQQPHQEHRSTSPLKQTGCVPTTVGVRQVHHVPDHPLVSRGQVGQHVAPQGPLGRRVQDQTHHLH